MVDSLRASGIRDSAVLGAMQRVPRHLFVEPALAVLNYLRQLSHASGEALERLGVRLAALMVPQVAVAHGPHAMAERFVTALGQAYRNRLNIKPTSDGKGAFRRFLDAVIEMVRKRHSDLDEFAGLLSEARLAEILARDH